MENTPYTLHHDTAVRRYFFEIDGHRAYIEYEERPLESERMSVA